ncbi:MAG: hypothetical protein HY294_00470 [Candidatus Rokubacteria bacterium]|nr:hypothetical protein [Candidatus Rokubacteria bacterium]MBI3824453.1 hypothetical protein [Candidatus Rokubacteria bacterium]
MTRRILLLNALLVAASAAFATVIVREVTAPMSLAIPARPRPATAPPAPAMATPGPGSAPATIVTHNLFSPTRTEVPATGVAGAAALNVGRLNLYGVVLRDSGPIAFLEDPATKRVAGYRIGDQVGGGTVQTIASDKVVLQRPEGAVDIRLHDPARQRAPMPNQPAGIQPGQPFIQPMPVPFPTQPFPPQPFAAPPTLPIQPFNVPFQNPLTPIEPRASTAPNPQEAIPGRRPLPPNLIRRAPSGTPTDATQR